MNGYKPWSNLDGFIRGFIICNQNEYVFVVTAGKHRAASLCNLYKKIYVRFEWSDFIPVVSRQKIYTLPQVVNGLYDENEARFLLNIYLNSIQ